MDIVLSEKRVFIGYPPWRRGARYNPAKMASCVVNLRSAGEDWQDQTDRYRPPMKTNRKFALSVGKGWIVVIPRPGDKICYVAEIAGDFELIDNPPWRARYLEFRRQHRLDVSDESSHVGDIVQSWRFSKLVKVPFGRIPRWITYRLLSRPTVGEIYGYPERGLHAHATLKRFIRGVPDPPLTTTNDLLEIQRRLLTFISPPPWNTYVSRFCNWSDPMRCGGTSVDLVTVVRTASVTRMIGCLQASCSANGFLKEIVSATYSIDHLKAQHEYLLR